MDAQDIRFNIKLLRRQKGITQKLIAEKLFIDERTYAKMERGENKLIDIRMLQSIAEILEVEVPELITVPTSNNLPKKKKENNKPIPNIDLGNIQRNQVKIFEQLGALLQRIDDLAEYQKKTVASIAQFIMLTGAEGEGKN